MSRNYYSNDKAKHSYDYENQVWIINGEYQRCGHPEQMTCGCFGRIHAGEKAVITEHCQ